MVPSRFQLSPAVRSTPFPARRPLPGGASKAMTPAANPLGLDLPLSCSATSMPLVAVFAGSIGAGAAVGGFVAGFGGSTTVVAVLPGGGDVTAASAVSSIVG